MTKPVILIPAYKPDQNILPDIISEISQFDIEQIIVVDDGSGQEYRSVFEKLKTMPGVTVLTSKVNQGKGAALRKGFQYITALPEKCGGVVTVDADGQHLPEDVAKIVESMKEHPESLILGTREFKGRVPFRSLLGNRTTQLLFRGFVGENISDTQTGLRGIPFSLLKTILGLQSERYAFELEMLLMMVRKDVQIRQVPIKTVYEDNNKSSSFRPVQDSIIIYRVLALWWLRYRLIQMLKYSVSGIFSTIADFGIYILLIKFSWGIAGASVLARIVSVIIHFTANRYFTFEKKDVPETREITRYLMVVCLNLFFSVVLIKVFVGFMNAGEVVSKFAAQMILFIFTYVLLNGFVFLSKKKTN